VDRLFFISDLQKLLDSDLSASFFELLLGVHGSFLANTSENFGASGFGHGLGFAETEAGQLTNDFDDVNLLGTRIFDDHIELGLLFDRFTSGSSTSSGNGYRSGAKSINRFELGEIYLALFVDKEFSPSCLDDDISERCDISFSDAELSDYQAACEKAGGKMLTFDFSVVSCVDEGDSFYGNLPLCVGKSCDDKEVCEAAADHEAKTIFGDSASCTTTTSCRASSSARLGRVLGSSSTISVGVAFLLWVLF